MSLPRSGVDVREVRCPTCNARTRTVPNPFFGTGLSVHRYVVQCVRCDWTRLVKDSERGISTLRQAPVQKVEEAPVAKRKRGLFGRRRD
jgi:DNA-directed RNA polymerase subunit RPC12/RpoP